MSCRIMKVTPQLVQALLLHCEAYESDLPKDVKLRNVTWNEGSELIEILLESATWAEPPEGERFPEIVATFRRTQIQPCPLKEE